LQIKESALKKEQEIDEPIPITPSVNNQSSILESIKNDEDSTSDETNKKVIKFDETI